MPILLDDIAQSVAMVKTYSPKFFDKKLTGAGKTIGLLNAARNPINIKPDQTTTSENTKTKKRTYTNGQTDTTLIPINMLSYDAWDYMDNIDRPDTTNMVDMADKTENNTHTHVYLDMTVHSIVLEETSLPSGGNDRVLTPCYQLLIYVVRDTANTKHARKSNLLHLQNTNKLGNLYYTDFTCNPKKTLEPICEQLELQSFNIHNDAILDYINNYCLYSAVVKRSEEWQTTIDNTLDTFFENIAKNHYSSTGLNTVAHALRRIEDYDVPLDLYKNIYASITKHFQPKDATTLCKQNLRLLLSDTLNNLHQKKNILTRIATPTPPIGLPAHLAKLSNEQQKAVTSTEPLILVQAGAGTGKSTVILGRIDYMIASGVNPADITVLSFTNAAADNITAKNPNVHSMTIARMIHNIYSANFTNHELSSIETIMNSLDIYFHDDDMAKQFKSKLYDVARNNSFTAMNNFIEAHYDEVINMLNTIKQTSLELEIIICYQQIDNFVEPADVASKFLIIDEVQDNSIFEFIYTLKYVDKHKESLFIVGDCSQTLYEFRAANPKALNVLEGSGVFATYQLQVNYRSNQEILDFANIALQNIEANQYAHIQLQANSLNKVTEQSFTDKVLLNYKRVAKLTEFNEGFPAIFATDVKPYIDTKLAAGEKVAFLAYTKNHVYKMQNALQNMYPDKKIANLVPERMYNSTVFSEFIKKYWSEVQFIPTKSITAVITQDIIAKLPYLTHDHEKALPSVQKMLANWRVEQQTLINNWQQQHMANRMSLDDFLNNVKESMLQFEIRSNAIRQALLSARNEENKKNQNTEDANFILSTIHSAKGLEFDNVVIIYQNKSALGEDEKRMYYVAFTRAMKSEYILAYDTAVHPKIESDYNTIVESLHAKAPKPNTGNTTVPIATTTDTQAAANV